MKRGQKLAARKQLHIPSRPRGAYSVRCGGCTKGRVAVAKSDTRKVENGRVATVTRALCGDCCRSGKTLRG